MFHILPITMPKKEKMQSFNSKESKFFSQWVKMRQFAKEDLKKWSTIDIQVMKIADTDHPRYWRIVVDQSTFDNVIKNYKNGVYPNEIPINIWHDMQTRAQARVKDIYQEGKALFMKVELTQEGSDNLKEWYYKYFSIEIHDVYETQDSKEIYKDVVVGWALTNNPYYTGMKKLAQKPKQEKEFTLSKNENMTFKELLAKENKSFSEKIELSKMYSELSEEEKVEHADAMKEVVEPKVETEEADVVKKEEEEKEDKTIEAKEHSTKIDALTQEVAALRAEKKYSDTEKKFSVFGLETAQIKTFATLNDDQTKAVFSQLKKANEAAEALKKTNVKTVGKYSAETAGGEVTDAEFAEKVREYAKSNKVDHGVAYKEIAKSFTIAR